MSDNLNQVMQCKAIVREAMDSCKNTIPGVTPVHIMIALVAECGAGMKYLPAEAKDKMFGACVTVLGQEAGLATVARKF